MMYRFTMALPLIALVAILAHSVRFNIERQTGISMAAHPTSTIIVTNFLERRRHLRALSSQNRLAPCKQENKSLCCVH
ncbi:MAG: hypothetical protein JWN98_2261 [Abditibacteriota bacterium]|nr:hypothetical protein [Abditibacteriota bacterium]